MRLNLADRLQTILRESIVSVDCAQNLVLIKTMAGLGPAAGAAFDGMDISAKVGDFAADMQIPLLNSINIVPYPAHVARAHPHGRGEGVCQRDVQRGPGRFAGARRKRLYAGGGRNAFIAARAVR